MNAIIALRAKLGGGNEGMLVTPAGAAGIVSALTIPTSYVFPHKRYDSAATATCVTTVCSCDRGQGRDALLAHAMYPLHPRAPHQFTRSSCWPCKHNGRPPCLRVLRL